MTKRMYEESEYNDLFVRNIALCLILITFVVLALFNNKLVK